ncbi:MAG: flagellar hook-length control protein FliK [Bryobacterales bacterium]|nr:flagellar hook-length control protein FliK [Bryobacterales bacterium]
MKAAAATDHGHIHAPANAYSAQSTRANEQAQPTAQSGFVDLINILLGTQSGSTSVEPGMEVSGEQRSDAEPLTPVAKARSPQEIAAALIRAMSGRDCNLSTNAFSDKPGNKSALRKQNDAGQNSMAIIPTVAPVPYITVAPTANCAADQFAAQTGRASEPLQIKTGKTKSGNTPVAFALKLTPKDINAEDSSSAVQEATPDQSQSATEPKLPGGESDQVAARAAQIDDMEAKARTPIETASGNTLAAQIHGPNLFEISVASPAAPRNQPPSIPVAPASSAEALRNLGPEAPAPVNPPSPAHEIAVRINRAEQAVDVHLTERGGQVHVAVRTPDPALQSSLRQDLGALVRSLDRAGYHAEASAPPSVNSTESPSSQMNGNSSQQQESGSSSGGRPGDQPSGQQHQRQSKHSAQDWMEVMENTQ